MDKRYLEREMGYLEFLNEVIKRGIAGARRDYSREDQRHKLEGSIEGFEACRGKRPAELRSLFDRAGIRTRELFLEHGDPEKYWRHRCYEMEIKWVCNCVSAVLANEGYDPIVPPTTRGVLAAAIIIGIKTTDRKGNGNRRAGISED